MDPAAFVALAEQCAPTPDLVQPLTAIVRQASSFEPLLITVQGRKSIAIQPTDRNEAIQLATEATATGKQVRTGLGQLDAEETKQAGLTAATTFDACQHVAGLGRLFDTRLQAADVKSSDRDQAIVRVVASFAGRASSPTPEPRVQPKASVGADGATVDVSPTNTPARSVSEHPRWDVYRSGLGTSAFVYER